MVVRGTCGGETDRTKTNKDQTSAKMEKSKRQPEREILRNVENPEIRKIRNNKQKCTKPELPKGPAKRKESQENKIREQIRESKSKSRKNPNQKRCDEASVGVRQADVW